MSGKEKTENSLEQLTPRERKVLRERFGTEKSQNESSIPFPPTGGEDGGSGGVPDPVSI